MKVSTAEPYQIIYSLLQHEYLGYLFESFVVQVDSRGQLTLLNQNISAKNVQEFSAGLDEVDFELVRMMDDIQQDAILRKFNPRKLSALDFFLKVYDPQKGDKVMQETIAGYLENAKSEILKKLPGRHLYIMGNDGNPAWKRVEWMPEKAKVRFYFMRNEENTHYFPTILYAGQKLSFQYLDGIVICDEPAWLVVDGRIYQFEGEVDGKKIRPFLKKKFIVIPRNVEDQYYRKFVVPLIASYDVVAKGIEIRRETVAAKPLLTLSETYLKSASQVPVLFGEDDGLEEARTDESEVVFDLSFLYGQHAFRFDNFAYTSNVSLEKKGDEYIFHKVKRDLTFEKNILRQLKSLNLDIRNGRIVMPKASAFEWVQNHLPQLTELGIDIQQNSENGKRYFLGYSSLEVSITEGRDWFDIYARVRFGEFEIPFIKLRNFILQNKKEFPLPNGEFAVIPDWWFTKYSELFAFIETHEEEDGLRLKKHHMMLVQELQQENLAAAVISRRLENLRDFQEIESYEPPKFFEGELRRYQKAGYDWLRFLNQYRFGGCLADDMGLGKTVQTLALLQSEKEAGVQAPSLLVMPTSLLYNWALEAKRFTPELKILQYTGTYREKNTEQFEAYDLILTSYGIVRLDVDMLKTFRFNYVILDESQAIKNPASNITKAVMKLHSAHRLILTGTPLENSTLDLWSQMTFINPGLLGGQTFFRKEYLLPIEKKNDEEKIQRLFHHIKPFILRRHKSQVATELPEKVESVHYCDMSEDQEKTYEEAKSYYRNMILQHIEDQGMSRSQMVVLQGLTRLRQLANHPRMVDEEYLGESGKFKDVMHKLETVISENHKILIFSQYVKHLELFRQYLNQKDIPYAYLDGSTRDRQKEVESFQNDESIRLFLISLKAGGVGLNLTAADYVFILDPWWNPAIEAQAIDRAHRIGQNRTVFIYKFISKNTVEEKILALQHTKKQLANSLISSEEGFLKSLSREDILALLD
ncbi:DEAD/DEAH box helicase [Arundinibacter roseus]|uniref:ATP-dependent helicase n=1 Tax=Arundinibacter roseus TaxID=2070510 RepID=A0A4R4K8Q7_9BACT|nr:SNF2-related protein [Arundinibacter roseus]TDB63970.1 ATP-dependent helicase [Arundinibacter roseus]